MTAKMLAIAFLLALVGCGKKADDIEQGNKDQAVGGKLQAADQSMSTSQTLLNAIESNDSIIAKEILKAGANLDTRFPNGETPLTLTLKKNKYSMLMTLMSASPDLNLKNKNGESPLHIAADKGLFYEAKLLLLKGADINALNQDGKTALDIALENKNEEISLALIIEGADLDRGLYLPEKEAEESGFERTTNLLKNIRDFRAVGSDEHIFLNITQGNVEFVEYLLKQRIIREESGPTLLGLALDIESIQLQQKMLRTLLSYGLRPDGSPKSEETPLTKAVKRENHYATRLLLDYGADANLLDANNLSPLFYAARIGSLELVKVLTRYGAKTRYKTEMNGAVGEIDVCLVVPTPRWGFFRRSTTYDLYEIKSILGCF